MNKDQIKQRKRQLAEQEYHESLKNIDKEVEANYVEYEKRLEMLNAVEASMLKAFEHQRNELAGEFGLLSPEKDQPLAASTSNP